MKKRTLSIFLAICMLMSVFPIGIFAADPPEETGIPVDMTYELGSESLTEFKGYRGETYGTRVSLNLISGQVIYIRAYGVDKALYLYSIVYGPSGEALKDFMGGNHSDGCGIDNGYTVPDDGTYTIAVFGANKTVTGKISIEIDYLCGYPFTKEEMFGSAIEFSGNVMNETLTTFDDFVGYSKEEGGSIESGRAYSLYMDKGDRLNVEAVVRSKDGVVYAYLYNADGSLAHYFRYAEIGTYLNQTYTATAANTYYLILECRSGFLYNLEIDLILSHATDDVLLPDELFDATSITDNREYFTAISDYRDIIIDGKVQPAYVVHRKISKDTTVYFSYGCNAGYDGVVYVYNKENGSYRRIMNRQDYDNYSGGGEQGSLEESYSEGDYYFVFIWQNFTEQGAPMAISIKTESPAMTRLETKLRSVSPASNFLINESVTFGESDEVSSRYYANTVFPKMYVFQSPADQDVVARIGYEEYPDFSGLDVLLYGVNKNGIYEIIEKAYIENGESWYFYLENEGIYAVVYLAEWDERYPGGKSFIADLQIPFPAPVSIDEYYRWRPITSLDTDYSITETLNLSTNFRSEYDSQWGNVDRYSGGHIKVNLTTGQRIAVSAYSETDTSIDTVTTVYTYDENGKIVRLSSLDYDGYRNVLDYSMGELDNVFIIPEDGVYCIAYGVWDPSANGSSITFSVRSLGVPEDVLTPSEAAMETPVTTLPYSAVVTSVYDNYYYFYDADEGSDSDDGAFGTAVKADLAANTPVYLTAYCTTPNAVRSLDTYFYIYRLDENGTVIFVDVLDNDNYAGLSERNSEFIPDTDATYLIIAYVLNEGVDEEYYIGISTTATSEDETYLYNGTYIGSITPGESPIKDEFTISSDRFTINRITPAFGKLYVVDSTEFTGVHITAEGKDGPVDLCIEYFAIDGGSDRVWINSNDAEDGKGEDVTIYGREDISYGIFVYTPYETDIGETVTVTVTANVPMRTRGDMLDSAVNVTEFPYTDMNIIDGSGMYLPDDESLILYGKLYKIDAFANDTFKIKSHSSYAMGEIDTRIAIYTMDESGELVEVGYFDNDNLGTAGEDCAFTAEYTGTYYVLVWTDRANWRFDLEKRYSVSIECIPEAFNAATDVTGELPFEFDHKFSENDIVLVDGDIYHGRVFKMTMEKDEKVELIFGTADRSYTDTVIGVWKKTETGRELVLNIDNDGYNGYGERVLFTAPEAGEYYFAFIKYDTDYCKDELCGYIKSGEGPDIDLSLENNSTEVTVPYFGSFNGDDVKGFYCDNGVSYVSGKSFRFTLDAAEYVFIASYSAYQMSYILVIKKTQYGWEYAGGSYYVTKNGSLMDIYLEEGEYCVVFTTKNEETPINVAIEVLDTDADDHALNFKNAEIDLEGDKWEWKGETKTLTLHDGFELRTVSETAITLPADSTVIIDGAVRVTSSTDEAFRCAGDLTVTAGENGGQLNMDFSNGGFVCEYSDLTLNGLEISFYGFGVFGLFEIFTVNNCNIDINTINQSKAINAASITFNGGSLKIVSKDWPIYLSRAYSFVLNCRYDITMIDQEADSLVGGAIKSDRDAIFYENADSETPLFEGSFDSSNVTCGARGAYSVDGVVVRRIVSVLTPPYALGDVNRDGRVNARDLLQLRLAVVGSVDIDEEQQVIANVNCDMYLNARDVLYLRLIVSGNLSVN